MHTGSRIECRSQVSGSFGSVYGKPLAHMREIVGLIRTIVAKGHTGELKRLDGEYHHLDLSNFRLLSPPIRPAIPIYLPAVFEKACEQAGEIADGLLGHPLWNDEWITIRYRPTCARASIAAPAHDAHSTST